MQSIEVRDHNVRLLVSSVAGQETCVYANIDGCAIVVDMGCVPEEQVVLAERVFVTHTHIDHVHGVTKHAALRRLRSIKPARYYCAPATVPKLERLFEATEELQESQIAHEIVPLAPSDNVPVQLFRGVSVVAFATVHRVQSQGYMFTKRSFKLKPELMGLPGHEIAARRRNGEYTHDMTDTLVLCVTGDTTAEALDRHPLCYEAKILVVECTYITDEIAPSKAHERGHIHINDLVARAHLFQNDVLVLMVKQSPSYSSIK